MDVNVSSFREFLSVINNLITDDEITNFVEQRIKFLDDKYPKKSISINNEGRLIGTTNAGYINSDSPITTSFMVDPFYLNDKTIYVEFIKQIKGKDITNLLNIFYELRNFTMNIFGFKGNQVIRENVYLQEKDKISIADFYKNNSALCTERSAAVQNVLEFCCIDSFFVLGKMEVDGRIEDHAYNIIKAKDGTLILFDSTNPVALDFGDNIGYIPAYTIIGKEDINNIEEVNFNFDFLSNAHKALIHKDEKGRKYRTCNYELNHQNSPKTM